MEARCPLAELALPVAVMAGIFGLLIGSFLNVVVYRVPAGMSLISPPSACPQCKSRIKPQDNIPLLSWMFLRGRCRNCGTAISPRYPLVEAGTALAFAAVALVGSLMSPRLDTTRQVTSGLLVLVAYLYLAAITVALALIDIDVHKLPNAIVLPSYLVAGVLFVAASVVGGDYMALVRSGVAMAALAFFYLVLALAYPGGMGLGDVKLAGVIGLYLGWSGWGALVVGALAAFLLGGIYSVVLLVLKRANRRSGIPFGPWMLAGGWLGVAAGNAIALSYLSLFGLTAT
ncbi:MAG: prepilin peptidase [Microbacteriaceae bacterium]|jgi:leader peptidase (prepilin peptidase)/N-methyltransferase|nr:prepilin peptidase [Microbacteriaceae bacterium]